MKTLLTFVLIGIVAMANAQGKKPKINVKDTAIYEFAEQQPQFGNDEGNFNKYLAKNLKYIPESNSEYIQTKFVASFVIEKDGTVSNIQRIKPQYTKTEDLFVKVLRNSPKWHPAVNHGYVVRYRYSTNLSLGLAVEE